MHYLCGVNLSEYDNSVFDDFFCYAFSANS